MARKKAEQAESTFAARIAEIAAGASANDAVTHITLTGEGIDGIELDVHRYVSGVAIASIANSIAESVIDMETAEYTPEAFDAALRASVLSAYAGVPMPDDYDALYALCFRTDMYNQVAEHVDELQLGIIIDCAQSRILHLRETITATAAQQAMRLLSDVAKVVDEMSAMTQELRSKEFAQAISAISSQGKKAPARKKRAAKPDSKVIDIASARREPVADTPTTPGNA